MLSSLDNVASLIVENGLSSTQAGLQKTLTELATGLRINSGADDAAGLSIVDGLHANIAALTQSSQNAVMGIGALQTSDGALSNVGLLLERAVTLATEAANGGLSPQQSHALDAEYQSILSEVDRIGGATTFNGENVFNSTGAIAYSSTQASLSASTGLTVGDITTVEDAKTGGTFKFKATAASTVADLEAAILSAAAAGTLSAGTTASIAGGHLTIATTTPGTTLQVSGTDAVLGAFLPNVTGTGTTTVFTSDGSASGSSTLSTNTAEPSSADLSLDFTTLNDPAHAAEALTALNSAVASNSASRGALGASINRLSAEINVANVTVINLTSASNNLEDADVGKTVAKMTQLNILQQTGMAAMSQSNQTRKALLRLLQSLG